MDAARFLLAGCLSPLHVTNIFHDVMLASSQGHSQILSHSPIFLHGCEIKSVGGLWTGLMSYMGVWYDY